MNLFDAHSIVSTLGLIGVLGIIFMETGLLIGLVFPGGEVVFLAGIAASGTGAALLGDAKLSAPLLFALAPVAAITGGELGYWFGKRYGRAFFERPNTRFFNIKMVETIEKWLNKYKTKGVKTQIDRIRKSPPGDDKIEEIKNFINSVSESPHLKRKVYIVVNFIEKSELVKKVNDIKNGKKFQNDCVILQILWFVNSLLSSSLERKVDFRIICRP